MTERSALSAFHQATRRWFEATFDAPSEAQEAGWPAIAAGEDVLIAAPTGSGKTLAAFLSAIDALIRESEAEPLTPGVRVLYVSPLKALTVDVEANLAAPLAGIEAQLGALGRDARRIRTGVRTGDTTTADRQRALRRPPHIYVTTPESLYLLLTSEGGRRMLADVRTVIVDEIHALIGDKRGSHLTLSLERLDALVGRRVQRIGLSATQRPIDEVARFLVGTRGLDAQGRARATIIDRGHRRALELAIALPRSPLETVMSSEVWEDVYDQLAELARQHRTTLVFVGNRRLAERIAHHLTKRLGADAVTSHHGSLSREHRLDAEQRLKAGSLRALVATASLELGIDVGDVELVCQVGAPGSIATLLQRVGRSGHSLGGTPKGRLFPTTRAELEEHVALLRAVEAGQLDRLRMAHAPLDILAQQIVATVAMEDIAEDALFERMRGAYPYAALRREDFDDVIAMLSDGFATARGRRGAYLHRDGVHGIVRARRGAGLVALTSGGAIPDSFDYEVRLEPTALRVGSLNEDFAIESSAGDIFQLGNASYRILRVEPGVVRVEDAAGQPPTIPFWLGEAPSRTDELSAAVSALRAEVDEALAAGEDVAARLARTPGVTAEAAQQLSDYLVASSLALGALPSQSRLVAERFFDEQGGQHIVIHSVFGSRLNRAFGLALRKRFCRSFNVELQAAANEDALVLSLGPMHSLPLEDVFGFLRSGNVVDVLTQALLDAPMFTTRFRWNASRALAIPRVRSGKRVPPRFLRMDSDDLLALCFPDQAACLENIVGEREIPEHPLVKQTIDDCLVEATDADRLRTLLAALERGEVEARAVDTTEPSPLAQTILHAKPYAFLDDAPLEERRTQAVMGRRFLDPASAASLGALDPAAIAKVAAEAAPDPRDAEEVHDALLVFGCLRADDPALAELDEPLASLVAASRVVSLQLEGARIWVASERASEVRLAYPDAPFLEGTVTQRMRPSHDAATTREGAVLRLVRGRLDASGPTTAREVAAYLCLPLEDVQGGLAALEGQGVLLRGRYRSDASEDEYCERGLLARIHRATLHRLRQEIKPVAASEYLRFLFRWQHLEPSTRLEGVEGLAAALEALQGFEAPAGAWEAELLPARVGAYDPSMLDVLCLGGRATYGRLLPAPGRKALTRATPLALMSREGARQLRHDPGGAADALGPDAARVHLALKDHGATFGADLPALTGLLPTRAEEALGELVAAGLVTSDGFQGVRALLGRRAKARPGRAKRSNHPVGAAGRWALLPAPEMTTDAEAWAHALLARYGVLFRRVLDREAGLPPFRELLPVLRRLEAQGRVRGGRFVEGFTGEQFALPEAVTMLRAVRREGETGALVRVSAADPANLVGLVTPGARVPVTLHTSILFRDGVPVAITEQGESRALDGQTLDLPAVRDVLRGRPLAPAVRAYLR